MALFGLKKVERFVSFDIFLIFGQFFIKFIFFMLFCLVIFFLCVLILAPRHDLQWAISKWNEARFRSPRR
jgi:hypothetical protein